MQCKGRHDSALLENDCLHSPYSKLKLTTITILESGAEKEDRGRRHFTVISFFKLEKGPEKPLRLEQGTN